MTPSREERETRLAVASNLAESTATRERTREQRDAAAETVRKASGDREQRGRSK
ncbi:hypothetical protein [Halapricum hydrolyticum]|uniref:Uncharacterized protein n=1 Tax=Halapricum hydrolyticum TaxID=2979991 RepID=A0AAE3LHM6_9EURY|nr:hypothetical protein [Halapricum hydrolyticum]MCU4717914.1 hypothetical protein [Halapricum hydrolyticum]MCU4727079.1 hypothetical protein [Halapricum hydrolyticum]